MLIYIRVEAWRLKLYNRRRIWIACSTLSWWEFDWELVCKSIIHSTSRTCNSTIKIQPRSIPVIQSDGARKTPRQGQMTADTLVTCDWANPREEVVAFRESGHGIISIHLKPACGQSYVQWLPSASLYSLTLLVHTLSQLSRRQLSTAGCLTINCMSSCCRRLVMEPSDAAPEGWSVCFPLAVACHR